MHLKEFAALKVGDKIENPADGGASVGEIVECTSSGVRVVWGPRHDRETRFFTALWVRLGFRGISCKIGMMRDD